MRNILIGYILGLATLGGIAFADDIPHALFNVDSFMIAGGADADGIGHKLLMDSEGRVICSPR